MTPEDEVMQLQLLHDPSTAIYKRLLRTLQARDFLGFERLVDRELQKHPPTLDLNYIYEHPVNKTLLDIACSNGWPEFIEFLLQNGAEPNKINKLHNRAPIHFAVEENHLSALEKLLQDPHIDMNIEAGMNSGVTPLHIAVKHQNLDCIKLLLNAGASPNIPNSKGMTPLHLAATLKNPLIVEFIVKKSDFVDIDSYRDVRKNTAREILKKNFPDLALPAIPVQKIDANQFRYYLYANHEKKFLENLDKVDYDSLPNKRELIKIAAKNNLIDAFAELMRRGCDLGGSSLLEIAEESVRKGHAEILKILLDTDRTLGNQLLLPAARELGMPYRSSSNRLDSRLKCLKLILDQDHVNVRCEDDKGNTPLHYAARAKSREAVDVLLEKGSYIGHMNHFGVPPLAHISPEILSAYFDSCIESKKERQDDFEIIFKYQCLVPHEIRSTSEDILIESQTKYQASATNVHGETDVLSYVAQHRSLKFVLKHPLISSFLYLKWHRMRYAFYANFIFYLLFYLIFNAFILITTYGIPGKSSLNETSVASTEIQAGGLKDISLIFTVTCIALILLILREVVQFLSSPCNYLSSFENWLEVTLIIIGCWVLGGAGPQIGSLAILLSAWKLVILIGQHPKMSTGIEMFKTVTRNFVKFLFVYIFLIIAFALSFFMLFRDDEDQNFPDPVHSLFKTIVMLTGEFEAGDIPFVKHPGFSHLVFVGFIFLIAIILLNLLTGLAVSNIAEILAEAELVALISRTRFAAYVEKLAIGSSTFPKTHDCCFCSYFPVNKLRLSPFRFLAKKVLLFPQFLPHETLSVKPFKHNELFIGGKNHKRRKCFTMRMDPNIVESAKTIIALRCCTSNEDKIATEFEAVKHRLKRVEELLEAITNKQDIV